MTTIFAVGTNHGNDKLIVFGADRQINGKANVWFLDKPEQSKLHTGTSFIAGIAGLFTSIPMTFIEYLKGEKTLEELFSSIVGNEGDMNKDLDFQFLDSRRRNLEEKVDPIDWAIRNGRFLEFGALNRYALKEKMGDIEYLSDMLLATNMNGGPKLYLIDSSGTVHPILAKDGVVYHTIGSGSKVVDEYMGREIGGKIFDPELLGRGDRIDLTKITRAAAFHLTTRVLEEAREKDGNTGGNTDYATITDRRVVAWYRKDKLEHEELNDAQYKRMIIGDADKAFKPS